MSRNSPSTNTVRVTRLAGPATFFFLLSLAAGCAPTSSDDVALVADQAALLQPRQRSRIATFHALLREDFDIDYRVVTTEEATDIDVYSASLFEELAAGGLSRSGRGLLLVIDPTHDRVRLEVGYALEGTFTDAFAAYVEQRQMVPFFQSSRVADGILATTEMIVTRAQRAAKNAGLESEVWLAGSGGGGASTQARIGDAPPDRVFETRARLHSGNSPTEVLTQYFARMQDRDGNPDLDIYTPATRAMLRDWVMTPAQMDNILKSYRRCQAEPERIDSGGRYGVIRYPIGQRQCATWFFKHVDGTWALDLTMMQEAIRFGRDNSWHFERGVEHPYAYAFLDWSFDSQGFPKSR